MRKGPSATDAMVAAAESGRRGALRATAGDGSTAQGSTPEGAEITLGELPSLTAAAGAVAARTRGAEHVGAGAGGAIPAVPRGFLACSPRGGSCSIRAPSATTSPAQQRSGAVCRFSLELPSSSSSKFAASVVHQHEPVA